MNKKLIQRIKKWCRDYKSITGIDREPDFETLEGDAYSILQEVLSLLKKQI